MSLLAAQARYLWYTAFYTLLTLSVPVFGLNARPHHLAPDEDQAVRDTKGPLVLSVGALLAVHPHTLRCCVIGKSLVIPTIHRAASG